MFSKPLLTTAVVAAIAMGIEMMGKNAAYGVVVVAFGDSTTAVRPTVPRVYAQILQEELPGLLLADVTVYNAGVGGNTTYNALQRLDLDVRSHAPNIVIIQFGINDCWVYDGTNYSNVPIDAATQVDHPHAAFGNYAANLTNMVSAMKADQTRVILMTPNQLKTTDLGPDGEEPWRNDLLGTYAQVVRNVAAAEDVELLDVWQMYADFAAVPGNNMSDLYNAGDPQHPGQLGHQMVADALTAMIAPEPSTLIMAATAAAVLLRVWNRRRHGVSHCKSDARYGWQMRRRVLRGQRRLFDS